MSLRKILGKTLPKPIKNILIGKTKTQQIKALKSLGHINCDTSNLLFENNVQLENIFSSPEANASWNESNKEISKFGIPDFTGGINPGDRRAIFYLMRYFKPKKVLEIGTHIGASTVNIASALKINQQEDNSTSLLRTVDIRDVNSTVEKPWLEYGTTQSPLEMIKDIKCDSFVKFITNTSFNFLKDNDDKFDLIFLDGDHSAETVYKEIPLALQHLNKDGVILLHDYFPNNKPLWSNNAIIHGPCLASQRHIENGADIFIKPLGDLPWPTKLGSNATSLALLLRKG